MKNYFIAFSIISANLAKLAESVETVISSGADIIHFDVMDNHYVPNLTFGPMVLKSLRKFGITAPVDVHLMTSPIDQLIPKFAVAGANCITFHPETTNHIDRSIQLIKKYNCKVGLAFNPTTPLNYLEYTLDKIDVILLMSVNPGFSGQTFLPSTFKKIRQARNFIDKTEKKIYLGIDGGINIENIDSIAKLGANIFVSGSAIFNRNKNYRETIKIMRKKIESTKFFSKKKIFFR